MCLAIAQAYNSQVMLCATYKMSDKFKTLVVISKNSD